MLSSLSLSLSQNGLLKKTMGPCQLWLTDSQATLSQRKASRVQHLSRQNNIAYIKSLVSESSETELEILVLRSKQKK